MEIIEEIGQHLLKIQNDPKLKKYVSVLFYSFLKPTGKFDYYDVEDLRQDIFIHLYASISGRKKKVMGDYTLDDKNGSDQVTKILKGYYTHALYRVSAKNYVIDLLRQKSSKLSVAAFDLDNSDFILDLVRHGDNEDQVIMMEEYLVSIGIEDMEEQELIRDIQSQLTEVQKEILQCLISPCSLYIQFFQVYYLELGIRNENRIISKYVGLTPKTYLKELGEIQREVKDCLKNRQLNT